MHKEKLCAEESHIAHKIIRNQIPDSLFSTGAVSMLRCAVFAQQVPAAGKVNGPAICIL